MRCGQQVLTASHDSIGPRSSLCVRCLTLKSQACKWCDATSETLLVSKRRSHFRKQENAKLKFILLMSENILRIGKAVIVLDDTSMNTLTSNLMLSNSDTSGLSKHEHSRGEHCNQQGGSTKTKCVCEQGKKQQGFVWAYPTMK